MSEQIWIQPACPTCGNDDKEKMSFGFNGQDRVLYFESGCCSKCGAIWKQRSNKRTHEVEIIGVVKHGNIGG